MTWRLHIPHRSPDAPVTEIAECVRALPEPERAVTRQLVLDLAVGHGARTVGDVLRIVEGSSPAERRALLDVARTRAGLEDTGTVDAHERFEATSHAARVTGGALSAWQLCHSSGCDAMPLSEVGIPCATTSRRWFCPAHRDEAEPGDLEPHTSGVRLSPSGALIPIDPDEEAREAAESESRRRLHDERVAGRQVEAAEAAESERLRAAAFRRELGPGIPG